MSTSTNTLTGLYTREALLTWQDKENAFKKILFRTWKIDVNFEAYNIDSVKEKITIKSIESKK